MPPKQATLGKFFGQPNGVAAKKQQSTSAFENSHTTKDKLGKTPDGKPVAKAADEPENKEEPAQGVEDEHDDVKMVDREVIEDRDGGMVKNEASNDHANTEHSGEPSSIAKSPGKRVKSDLKEDEQDDNEDVDEEPVKKRPRRGETRKESKPNSKKSAALQPRDSSESKKPKPIPKTDGKTTKPHIDEKTAAKKPDKLGSRSKAKTAVSEKACEKKTPKETLSPKPTKAVQTLEEVDEDAQEVEDEEGDSEEDEKPEIAAKAREKVQSTLKSQGKDPYPDWKPGEPVP
ncbi:MAG: hypothetical protein Q9187_008338, partial [Circinaria calcarea]